MMRETKISENYTVESLLKLRSKKDRTAKWRSNSYRTHKEKKEKKH